MELIRATVCHAAAELGDDAELAKDSVQEVSQSSLQNMAAATFLNNVALIMCRVP